MTDESATDQAGMQGKNGGPPLGFGKGVHEYLGHYVDVADTKIGVLTGLALAVLGFLLTKNTSSLPLDLAKWIGVGSEIVAIAAGAFALYPRLTSGGGSPIFWEDVSSRDGAIRYFEDLEKLDDIAVEREYALQNYYLSQILHRKYYGVRIGMAAFLAGSAMAALVIVLA